MNNKIKNIEKRKNRTTLQIKRNNKAKRKILSVFKSNKHIYAQVIDLNGKVLVQSSSNSKTNKDNLAKKTGLEIAEFIGEEIAKKAIEQNIKEVVFNKGPYMYIGRVKALADSARKAGLIF